MGVLTHKLQGSITALAAVAAVSVCTELPEKSCLSQTLLLSSLYAPIALSSFEVDFGVLNPPHMVPMALPQPASMPPMVHSFPPSRTCSIIPSSSFISQSAAVRFYEAKPAIPHGKPAPQWSPQGVFYSSRLLPSMTKTSPLLMLNAASIHTTSSLALGHSRSIESPANAQRLHAHIKAHRRITAELPYIRLPQAFPFEKMLTFLNGGHGSAPMASTALLHMWHGALDNPKSDDGETQLVKHKPSVAVVLLGWLGAEHRHLKKYADWYTSRGIHAVTFVVPMKDLLTFKAGDRAEKHVDLLTQNLVQWLREDACQGDEKIVIFHTFSNTGWLTYGAVLERLINHGDKFLEKIKGCVVDSAPSARPDPQVWASGFSAALLKKSSVATQMVQSYGADGWNGTMIPYPKPSLKETALLAMLEKFFSVFLQIPYVNRRLNDVVSVLANQQPSCPQLYIYSSADTVIPAKSVEAFIEEQKKAGHMVSACNFQCSPHVDHFRTFPEKYSEQLTSFLKVCVPQWAIQ
eukprot:c28933_g1_i1 orf=313-1872(+)